MLNWLLNNFIYILWINILRYLKYFIFFNLLFKICLFIRDYIVEIYLLRILFRFTVYLLLWLIVRNYCYIRLCILYFRLNAYKLSQLIHRDFWMILFLICGFFFDAYLLLKLCFILKKLLITVFDRIIIPNN